MTANNALISAKITITTDLGEAFLALDLVIVVDIVDQSGASIYGSKPPRVLVWKGSHGMRALEITCSRPLNVKRGQSLQMLVRPHVESYAVDSFLPVLQDALTNDHEDPVESGRVVAVKSMPIDVTGTSRHPMDMAERVFSCCNSCGEEAKVHIWEETGESIARHIW